MKRILFLFSAAVLSCAYAAGQSRWSVLPPGGGIEWNVTGDGVPHYDHIEMSGEQMAFVLRWGIDASGAFRQERSLVFPMLRTVPNNTHASLMMRIATDIPSLLSVNGLSLQAEKADKVNINGALNVTGVFSIGKSNVGSAKNITLTPAISVSRSIFPSMELPLMCERYTVTNITGKDITLLVPEFSQVFTTDPRKGVDGAYVVRGDITGGGTYVLKPSESVTFGAIFQAYRDGGRPVFPDPGAEYDRRMSFVEGVIDSNLILETPEKIIDTEFRFAKLRASESIFKTKGGYMHGPGGESYYAAIWANDQAEYVNPFFPFLGYDVGNESAMNSFRHFARFMNPEYKPIPSSIIAEGDDIWHGVGDRGDGAMIAYGAARYALASGVRRQAEELWPLIEWCLEYCRRQLNGDGVVKSDTDELENRFPSGSANLCTSALYYDALLSAASLAAEIGKGGRIQSAYRRQAKELAVSIEKYFGADVGGYRTYRYYDGNELLRSWICMPLIVGINGRAAGTVDALLGPEMMTPDGLLTQQGSSTFWDRSTLYALRGIYSAGYGDKATEQLLHYSSRRLLGDHVPYPIEAWPEGSQRHLSAESGLYCRIVTEGMFGIRPVGLRSFDLAPRLPSGWDFMRLKHIKAFGGDFDIEVTRAGQKRLKVIVSQHGGKVSEFSVTEGATIKGITIGK